MNADQLKAYYEEMIADTEPGAPGGRIAWSSSDYATQEEEDAAFEAFVKEIAEGPDDDE